MIYSQIYHTFAPLATNTNVGMKVLLSNFIKASFLGDIAIFCTILCKDMLEAPGIGFESLHLTIVHLLILIKMDSPQQAIPI